MDNFDLVKVKVKVIYDPILLLALIFAAVASSFVDLQCSGHTLKEIISQID